MTAAWGTEYQPVCELAGDSTLLQCLHSLQVHVQLHKLIRLIPRWKTQFINIHMLHWLQANRALGTIPTDPTLKNTVHQHTLVTLASSKQGFGNYSH